MNHTYKHIWSKTLGRLVIVPECCKGGQGRKGGKAKLGAVAVAAATVLASPALAQSALPTGGTVVSGAATIATSGAAMTINQSSDKLIANWQSFSIGAGNSVAFNQPGASSVALNRVTGQDASQILGSLTANGQVFLVNPNGIAIGKTGSVQTGGFVASTLGISDANFLAGNYRFTGTSGTITNEGSVSGKTVALISPVVSNSGTITGNTALAAGTDVQLDFNGDGLLSVEVKASTMATLVENKGLIRADGGVAILTAKGASAAMKGVVNNTGTIEANSIGTRNGRILLLGDMQHGEVKAAGKLKAKFVETSAAKVTIDNDLKVDAQGGKWLIDPTNIEINSDNVAAYVNALAGGTAVEIATPATGTDAGNIAINAAMSWTSSAVLTLTAHNNIAINAAISAASGGLTINAGGTITATAGISLGTFVLNSGNWQQNAATLPTFSAGNFTINGGTFLRVTGGDGSSATPYLLADVYGLQGVGSSASYLAANWKLAADINAAGTAAWNGSAGFKPVATGSSFSGTFDGAGHVISGLTLAPASGNAGLFDTIDYTGTVKNLGIVNATVSSSTTAGILAGASNGTVINVWTSGTVTNSAENTGGLVGANSGTISGSWSSATVYGSQIVGGLVGLNDGTISGSWSSSKVNTYASAGGLVGWQTGGSVTSSYATGAVQATYNLGGLVGQQTGGSLINVYATGAVSGSSGSTGVGGLVGYLRHGSVNYAYATGAVAAPSCAGCSVGGLVGISFVTVTNSFWDINTTGRSSSNGGGTGLTTAQARSAASYTGWDFANVWYQNGDMRPILRAEAATADSNGVITISNLHQLALMGANLSGNYKLAVNLDASATKGLNASDIWSTNGWVGLASFAGTLDGSKHAISGLTSNTGGLFASTTSAATIHDLGVTNASISGTGGFTGILVDDNAGTLTNVSTSGTVSGESTGGLAGQSSGAISGSWSSAEVDAHWPWSGGTYSAGGLVAVLTASGTISQSYASGLMNYGMGYVGGLVGSNYGTISFSYATGAVPLSSVANGGLVSANFGTISNSYATGAIGASGLSGGLVAANYGTISQSYAAGSVDTGIFGGGGLVGYTEGTITASFWDTQASGLSTGVGSGPSTGVTGLTTAQMQNPTNFINAGWDYASTWAMVKTGGAPVLRALTSDPVYTYYVNLTGNTSTTYGDGITSTSGITVGGIGAGNVSVAWGSAIGATTNAGTYGYGGINVLSLSYSAGAAGDYYVDYGSGSLTINKRVVSLSGTRTYDGSTDVGAGALTIGNLANGDTLALSGIGQLASKNVGTGLGFALGTLALGNGSGLASNYTLVGGATTVDITKAVLTVTDFTVANKNYDGNITATIVNQGALAGVVLNDSVSFMAASASFADKNAGTGKTVTLNGTTLAGVDAGNYMLGPVTTTADIAKVTITSISGITALSKPYDGSTTAALVYSGAFFNGMLAGDLLSVASGTGAFADSNSGNGKRVNITGLSLGGLDARNYTLASTTATTTADINASVAPVLPPPNTIDTGTSAINGIGSTARASFVVTTADAFAQPVLIDVALPANVGSDTRSDTRKRRDDDQ